MGNNAMFCSDDNRGEKKEISVVSKNKLNPGELFLPLSKFGSNIEEAKIIKGFPEQMEKTNQSTGKLNPVYCLDDYLSKYFNESLIQIIKNQNQFEKEFINFKSQINPFNDNELFIENFEKVFKISAKEEWAYEGNINQQGLFHGYGKLAKQNSDYYEGYFEFGKFQPIGKYINTEGSIFISNFLDYLPHGQGIQIQNSNKYIGNFFYGLKNGIGKEFFSDENFEGEFKLGLRDGKGILISKNNDKYEGEFKNGKISGFGEYLWNNGDKYLGQLNDGYFEGKGKYIWSEGMEYEGNYEKGQRQGLGLFKWKEGKIYKGEFHQNVPHGEGIIIDEEGKHNFVIFDKGKLTKKLNLYVKASKSIS